MSKLDTFVRLSEAYSIPCGVLLWLGACFIYEGKHSDEQNARRNSNWLWYFKFVILYQYESTRVEKRRTYVISLCVFWHITGENMPEFAIIRVIRNKHYSQSYRNKKILEKSFYRSHCEAGRKYGASITEELKEPWIVWKVIDTLYHFFYMLYLYVLLLKKPALFGFEFVFHARACCILLCGVCRKYWFLRFYLLVFLILLMLFSY